MILLTVVYSHLWYHDLNIIVLQVQEDILVGRSRDSRFVVRLSEYCQDTPRFPAVAVLQDTKQSTQPNLVVSQAPKCWSGLFDPSAPPCETLSEQQYSDLPSCNCNNSWSSNLDGTFYWSVGAFNYFLFTPPPNIISKHPGYHMTIQVFFNCQHISILFVYQALIDTADNASEALSAVSVTPSPDLQLAIFDPASGLEQALNSGYSPLNLFNANGLSYINLNLNLRHSIGVAPTYDYGT